MLRQTFGQLLDKIVGGFALDADQRQILKDAKSFRDYLAHEFWIINLPGLYDEEGLSLIVEQCESLEIQFRLVTQLVFDATQVNAEQYVTWTKQRSQDSTWRYEMRRLLDDVWQAHRDAGHI